MKPRGEISPVRPLKWSILLFLFVLYRFVLYRFFPSQIFTRRIDYTGVL